MLLKSKSSRAPRSDDASAAFARSSRYVRRRSGLTRSSQSTVWPPGEAKGRVAIDGGVAASMALNGVLLLGRHRRTGAERPFTNATQWTVRRRLRRSRSTQREGRSQESTVANHVGRVDWSFSAAPTPASERSSGLARQILVGPGQGAVHTELAAGAFAAGGWVRRHLPLFEEGLYGPSGELLFWTRRGGHR